MCSILFDTQDANLVREINQNSCPNNLFDGPSAVHARRDELVLSLETLRAHRVQKTSKFSLVWHGPIILSASQPRVC